MKKSIFAALAALFLIASTAHAAEGLNVGVDVGTHSAKSASIGYNFTPAIGAEVSYTRFGDYTGYKIGGYSAHDSLVNVSLVGTKPLIENLDLVGKIGRANVITVAKTPGAGGTTLTSQVWTYSIGVVYHVVGGLGVRAAIDGMTGSGIDGGNVKNYETVGLTYAF